MDLQIIQKTIFEIRGCRVMLDFHLAELYRVETRVLKQAVRRNIDRFPVDFMFELSKKEGENIIQQGISQFVIPPSYNVGASSIFAFTEQGVAMLSSVLRSPTAIKMNITIIRAFVLMRQFAVEYDELYRRLEMLESSTDAQFSEIYQALTELLSIKEEHEKPRHIIGYKQ